MPPKNTQFIMIKLLLKLGFIKINNNEYIKDNWPVLSLLSLKQI